MATQISICYRRGNMRMRGGDDVYEKRFKERTRSSSGRSEYLGKESKVAYGGIVYKGQVTVTGAIWATKVEKGGFSAAATNKEIDMLQSLGRHPSMLRLYCVKLTGDYAIASMEYVETDLRSYVAYLDREDVFTITQLKKLMLQLLQGVQFLHENGVVHGHLHRPHNILVRGGGGGSLKICNLGKATRVPPPRFLQESKVDMRSVGCVMAELVLDRLGGDERDEVYRILGKGKGKGKPAAAAAAAYSNNSSNRIFILKEDGFDLLKGLLTGTITAKSAPNHVWFHDHHQLHHHHED